MPMLAGSSSATVVARQSRKICGCIGVPNSLAVTALIVRWTSLIVERVTAPREPQTIAFRGADQQLRSPMVQIPFEIRHHHRRVRRFVLAAGLGLAARNVDRPLPACRVQVLTHNQGGKVLGAQGSGCKRGQHQPVTKADRGHARGARPRDLCFLHQPDAGLDEFAGGTDEWQLRFDRTSLGGPGARHATEPGPVVGRGKDCGEPGQRAHPTTYRIWRDAAAQMYDIGVYP